jgi:Rab GDP dissociation inhibitor
VSDTHKVAAKGKYLAMVSTTVETSNPEQELKPALDLLGEIDEKFVFVTDLYEPNDDGADRKVCVKISVWLVVKSTYLLIYISFNS